LLADNWKKYWLKQKDASENSKLIHFIGKDNIVFHAIIFPMMLLQHGEFVLPTNVPANEFLNLEGDKISTSRNWAVWLHEYLKDFPGKEDVLRYTLTSIAPETKDSDFSWKDFQARNNNELVAILGNFINRTLVLTQKFYNGTVPQYGELHASDKACIEEMKNAPLRIGELIEKFKFREAQSELMNLARVGNKYLAENEPWKLIKINEERVKTIMYISLEVSAYLAVLCAPFFPNSSLKVYEMLNLKKINWNEAKGQILKPGHQLGEAKLLFEKIEDDVIEKQIQKLHAAKNMNEIKSSDSTENKVVPIGEDLGGALKPETSFDDFSKMDLRTATILEAERVPKTDKLLKLKIDLGFEHRTIVSGIAHCYEPEKIIGQQVTVIANLAPRKIKGIESKGMILMAENADGKLKFVMPSEEISNGSTVK
jgi:methionyl-tRNA synthetase